MKQRERFDYILKTPWLIVDLVVLYIVFSLFGVFLEGTYTLLYTGHWETHVVSMIGPFCVIYGFGAVLYYVAGALVRHKSFPFRFLVYASIGTVFELLCGLLLMYGLNMRAWDYTDSFMNYKGLICLSMFGAWGALGIGLNYFLPKVHNLLSKLHRQPFGVLAVIIAVILFADLIATGICIVRWKNRRYDVPATSALERLIDEHCPDAYMQKRFIEWRFLDAEQTPETQGQTTAVPEQVPAA